MRAPSPSFKRSRSRSRSPPPPASSEDLREGLARHEGAQRSLQPAWARRGIGVNDEILGETRGDLVKPGVRQADLDKWEKPAQEQSSTADPLGDFFDSRHDSKSQQQSKSPDPLSDFFDSRHDSKSQQPSRNSDPLSDFFDSRHESSGQQRSKSSDPLGDFFDSRHTSSEQKYQTQRESWHGHSQWNRESWNDSQGSTYQRDYQQSNHRHTNDSWNGKHESSYQDNQSWKKSWDASSRSDYAESSAAWKDSKEPSYQSEVKEDHWKSGKQSSWERGWHSEQSVGSDDFQVLIDMARRALSEGGFIEGHRLGQLMIRHHRDAVSQAKERFGSSGWMRRMIQEITTDIRLVTLSDYGGPCFYVDSDGNSEVPSYQAPAIIEGDKVPLKGNAQVLKKQPKKENMTKSEESPESPEPEHVPEPLVGGTASSADRDEPQESVSAQEEPAEEEELKINVWDLL